MTITRNKLIWSDSDGGRFYQPDSGYDDLERDEMAVIFTYEPPNYPDLQIVLRAKSALIPLGSSGHRLGFEWSLTGKEGTKDANGQQIRGLMLGTGIEILDTVVAAALTKGENPILAIFDAQPDLFADFFANSAKAFHFIQSNLIASNANKPTKLVGKSKSI
jgi:hypothetical protein